MNFAVAIRVMLTLTSIIFVTTVNQNCTQSAFQAAGYYGTGVTYSRTSNTFIIAGNYKEFIVDHDEGRTSSIVSIVQDSNNRSYHFKKDFKTQEKLGAIQIGDKVQLEISATTQIQKFFSASSKLTDGHLSQVEVEPLFIKRISLGAFEDQKMGSANVNELDFSIAIVYLDYLDYQAHPTDYDLAQGVIDILTGSTWNTIRLHLSEADFYRLRINANYPGCERWYEPGAQAIAHVNQTLKKQYHRVVAILPSADVGTCNWSGITSSSQSFLFEGPSPIVSRHPSAYNLAHELGHSLGLGHSANEGSDNYGDQVDVMGRGNSLNISKLIDLRVLENGFGLVQAPTTSQTIVIHGKKTNVFDRSVNVAIQYLDHFVSLSENHGLTIHRRTGAGANGNEPSSYQVAILQPGEAWESRDRQFKIQFLNWDLIQNFATVRVNGNYETNFGYIGGCLLYRYDSPNLTFEDSFTDANFGFLEFTAGNIGAVGDCGTEKFRVEITSEDSDFQTWNNFEFSVDITSNQRPILFIPYRRMGSQSNVRVRTKIYLSDRLLSDKSFDLKKNDCVRMFQSCERKDECNLPSLLNLEIDFDHVKVGETRSGHLIVNNPNGASCSLQEYHLQVSQIGNLPEDGRLTEDQIEIEQSLTEAVRTTSSILSKKLFLSPGKSVKIPISFKITTSNINTVFQIWSIGVGTSANFIRQLYFGWRSELPSYVNKFLAQTSSLEHPFRPLALTALNTTGLLSSMSPTCTMEVPGHVSSAGIYQIQISEGDSLSLKFTTEYGGQIQKKCGNSAWTDVALNSRSELILPDIVQPMTCEFRVNRNDDGQSKTALCASGQKISVSVSRPDKTTCTTTASSNLQQLTLDVAFRISDTNSGKAGYKFLAAKTIDNRWFSFDGTIWKLGIVAFDSHNTFLNEISPFRLFNSQNLTEYLGAKIYFGYGIGANQDEALNDLDLNGRLFLCHEIR